MKKKEKIYILIKLLGVITIISSILIITISSTNEINDNKEKSFKKSVQKIVDAVYIHVNNNMNKDRLEYEYIDQNLYYVYKIYNSEMDTYIKQQEIIKMEEILENGSGTIIFDSLINDMVVNITNGFYCATNSGKEINIKKGNCHNY